MPRNVSKDYRLSAEELAIVRLVSKDPIAFASFASIIHPLHGKIPFHLFDFQKAVIFQFLQHDRNIVLKFRQAGMTELIGLYCLWFAMFHPYKNIIIISIKEVTAKKFLRRIKFIYEHLPDFLKVRVVNGKGGSIGTETEIVFANHSTITSIPTTEDAGRSESVSLLVIDEAAIIRWADKIWEAAWPTLSTGGKAILNSTPYGTGNLYHNLWTQAISNDIAINPIRLRWWMHPERDEEWYKRESKVLGPRRTAQEIDADFLSSGNTVFDLTDIRGIEDEIAEAKVIESRFNGNLRLYEPPIPGKTYYIGADVATGLSEDFSAFSIMTREGKEVGCYKGKIVVGSFAELLMELGNKYNKAVLAPEANDVGLAVVSKIQEAGYPNLYYSTAILKKRVEFGHWGDGLDTEKRPGWYTTGKNRNTIIQNLEEDIRLGRITIRDPFFVTEAYTFIYDERNKPIAQGKNKRGGSEDTRYTDDSIIAKAITNHIRKRNFDSSPLILPR
jgi:hypothetical protein